VTDGTATTPGLTRRRVLALAALAPVVAACTAAGTDDGGPDPLPALADAARADAALAAAALTADPTLTGRLEPLRAARAEHAAALDVALGAPPAPAAAAPAAGGDLAAVRVAVQASAAAAAAAVPDLPGERVGLVASIAACCATYAELLT